MEYNKKFSIFNFQFSIFRYWHYFLLILLAVVFFFGVSSFNYFAQKDNFVKWFSPDETANYTFAKLYGESGELKIFEKYNLYAKDVIHPRSFRSDLGALKPVSFLGIILIYGKIVSVFGSKILPYLTPFFGAAGILFFYLLIKEIFGRRNAFISAFLLASFPVYLYYSARSMFHNVLFIVLLVMGLYFGVKMAKKSQNRSLTPNEGAKLLAAAFSGFFIGLAIIARASELLWVAPMLIILWLLNIKKIGLVKLLIFLSFLFLSFFPVFYWNKILYGSPWQGGYPEMNESIAGIGAVSSDFVKTMVAGKMQYTKELAGKLKDYIFHFGFNPYQSFKTFYFYFVKMFFWLFWPAVLGFLLFLFKLREWKKGHIAYLASYFFISLILLFYYGSWGFHDNPDPKSFTIGNSYTRYWLPIYLGALPFVSMAIIYLTKIRSLAPFRGAKLLAVGARIIIIGLIFFLSVKFVLFGSEEGLVNSYYKLLAVKDEFRAVLKITEDNAIIITRYHDKLFFPERKVIVGLFDDPNMVAEYAKLADYLPVYYYNFTLPEKDLKYLNERRLPPAGLEIMEVKKITDDFTLYKLNRINPMLASQSI